MLKSTHFKPLILSELLATHRDVVAWDAYGAIYLSPVRTTTCVGWYYSHFEDLTPMFHFIKDLLAENKCATIKCGYKYLYDD